MREAKLRRLIRIMEESGVESLEIPHFFRMVKISRKLNSNGQGDSANLVGQPPTPALQPSPTAAPPPAPAEKETSHLIEITSPMVGTFYRAPTPDSDAFVEVGTRVSSGDTVCIIEAMKLLNEIEAEVAGVIKEIHVENGEPIEYGQTLFLIDPKG